MAEYVLIGALCAKQEKGAYALSPAHVSHEPYERVVIEDVSRELLTVDQGHERTAADQDTSAAEDDAMAIDDVEEQEEAAEGAGARDQRWARTCAVAYRRPRV